MRNLEQAREHELRPRLHVLGKVLGPGPARGRERVDRLVGSQVAGEPAVVRDLAGPGSDQEQRWARAPDLEADEIGLLG